MCVPVLKWHQLQGALPPDPPPGALPPGLPLGAPPPDPRYRLALPRSPYCGLNPPYIIIFCRRHCVAMVRTVCRSRSWRERLAREARMKQLESALVDDSVTSDVARNTTTTTTTPGRGRSSVQSKSYDVMYCTTKSHRNDGRKTAQCPQNYCVINTSAKEVMFSPALIS